MQKYLDNFPMNNIVVQVTRNNRGKIVFSRIDINSPSLLLRVFFKWLIDRILAYKFSQSSATLQGGEIFRGGK